MSYFFLQLPSQMHTNISADTRKWTDSKENREQEPRIGILAKTQKIENSNLHGFELHRPSGKGTQLLLQVIKAIINQ